MNTDPELSSVAEILIAMKKLPDAELLDLLAAVEKEGIQTPEFNAPENEQVETDALAVLLNEIGPSVVLTHSSTGIRGWITGIKSDKVAAIVGYEPGAYVYPEGELPPCIPRADGTCQVAGREVPFRIS